MFYAQTDDTVIIKAQEETEMAMVCTSGLVDTARLVKDQFLRHMGGTSTAGPLVRPMIDVLMRVPFVHCHKGLLMGDRHMGYSCS